MQSPVADAGLIIVDPAALTAAESNNPRAGTPRTWEEEGATAWIKAIASLRTLTAARIGLRIALTKPESRQFEHEVGGYARVARYAAEAHIDLLEIDSAGVPAEDRVAVDLLAGVRSLWPAGRPISVRLAAWSDPENDQAVEAGLQYAEALKASGCDVLAVAMPPALARLDSERARVAHAFTSDLIRNAVGLPTMLMRGTHTVGDVNTLILSGQADLCEWPRLAWPGWRPQPGQPVPR
jgi:2,4-dienoyl-CoA reductase-like NADH-dependent reductase (Old Yellow Enzyme family)